MKAFIFLLTFGILNSASAANSDLLAPYLGTWVRSSDVPASICAAEKIVITIEGRDLIEKTYFKGPGFMTTVFPEINSDGKVDRIERRKSDTGFGYTLRYTTSKVKSESKGLGVYQYSRGRWDKYSVSNELHFQGNTLVTGLDLVCKMVRL
ncbi:MAG: hypothetical protein AB7O96_08930 [Pseudobdellovibrionaceae bacterium]